MGQKPITKDDVWGTFDPDTFKRLTKGMLVAHGIPSFKTLEEHVEHFKLSMLPDICPVWRDKLPYKSVTVICDSDQQDEVEGQLMYVHGSDCIQMVKGLPNGKVAIRSDYMCW